MSVRSSLVAARRAYRLLRRVSLVAAILLLVVPAAALAQSLSVNPAGQSDGGTVTLSGGGFAASSPVTFTFDGSALVTNPAVVTTDGSGNLPSSVTFTVPSGTSVGSHTVEASDGVNTANTPMAVDSISVSPAGQSDGGTVTVGGSGFAPSSTVTVSLDGTIVATTTSDASGNLPSGVTFAVPGGIAVGSHTVSATDASGDTASAPLNVDSISVSPPGQSDGGPVTVSGSGFAPGSTVTISFDGRTVATATADGSGSLPSGVAFNVPDGTAVGSYPVTATDSSGDTASSSLNVDSVSVNPAGQSIGGSVTVSGGGFVPSSHVTITFEGKTVATPTADGSGNLPSGVKFAIPGGTSVGPHTLTATDPGGDTASTPLAVDSISVTPSGQSIGGTVTVSGSGFAPNSPMTIEVNNSAVATSPSPVMTDSSGNLPPNVTFTVPGTSVGSHPVSVTDASGDTASTPINVDSLSVSPSGQDVGGLVSVSGSGFAPNSPVTISLDNTTVATPTSDGSGNLPSGVTFAVPAGTPTGPHTVSATDPSGDTASRPLNVDSVSVSPAGQSVDQPVTVSGGGFTPNSVVTISFDGAAVATPTSDGSGNLPAGVTFNVPSTATTGPHTVTAADGSGDSADFTLSVDSVSVLPTSGVGGDSLTNVSGAGWLADDQIQIQIGGESACLVVANSSGNISGQNSACHVPSGLTSGPQPVTATDLSNPSRQATAAGSFTIQGPTASFTASQTTVPTGTPVTFNAGPSANPIAQYNWDFGDHQTSTSSSPTHAYTTPGNYVVTLTVADSEGDQSTAQQTITVTPRAPTAAFNPTSATVLAGSPVAFDGTPSSDPNGGGTLSYSWNFGDGGTATGAQPSHTYAMPGTYNVSLSLSDNYGQTSSLTHQITVIAPPPIQTLILTPVAKPTIVKGGGASATRSGVVDLGERLFCPGPGPHCVAYILAWSRSLIHGASGARINPRAIAATEAIKIKPDGSAEVKFKLSKKAFAFLRRKHRLPIRARIILVRGQQTTTSTVSLVFVLR